MQNLVRKVCAHKKQRHPLDTGVRRRRQAGRQRRKDSGMDKAIPRTLGRWRVPPTRWSTTRGQARTQLIDHPDPKCQWLVRIRSRSQAMSAACRECRGLTLALSKLLVGSLRRASSAAAEDTETAPEAMLVSARTRLPAVIACLNRPFMWRPKLGQFWPTLYTCLHCARICPSPCTKESSPPDTLHPPTLTHDEPPSPWTIKSLDH